MRPVLTFTTDFGADGPYVAEMKGVAISLCPDATLVDVTHDVPPQNVRAGAFVMMRVVPHYPAGTVHVGVVDPGVGTDRAIICLRVAGQFLVGPDNGLLSWAAEKLADLHDSKIECRRVANKELWRGEVSSTFHGRDIMTPVAAHLARGVPFDAVGPRMDDWLRLAWPPIERNATSVTGEVIFVDHFGNLVTNVPGSAVQQLAGQGRLMCDAGALRGIPVVNTYGAATPGSVVCIVGSADLAEIAVVNGNAAERLGLPIGQRVTIRCHEEGQEL